MDAQQELAAPLALRCGRTLRNRLCKVATSEHLGGARSNDATPLLGELYGRWALGGWGLVVTGNVMVDRRALEAPRNVVFDARTDEAPVVAWASAATGGGALALAQLSHPGRQSPLAASWRRPRAPASAPLRLGGIGPRLHRAPVPLTASEVEAIVRAFETAARLAKRCGFDGVQVHAAHGYLLSQFLSTGSTSIVVDVCRACRKAIGKGGVLSIKVNASDFDGSTNDAEKLKAVLLVLDSDPLIALDLVEVSGGTYASGMACLGDGADFPGAGPSLTFAPHVRRLRARTNLRAALLLAGGVADAARARRALRVADVAGVARAACVDPACAAKWLRGAESVALRPPAFGRMPARLGGRRVWVPGLNYGWHQRQLGRLARGREAVLLSHWPFLLGALPRALLFEPARWPPWWYALAALGCLTCKMC
jgi:2,4-dienoyl-CoA reductase-like NADH-dependent reductase (Old Yellow Enzyme family)